LVALVALLALLGLLALDALGAEGAALEALAGLVAGAAGGSAGAGLAAVAGVPGVGRMQVVPRRVAPGGQLVGVAMTGECGSDGAPWVVPERARRRFSSSDSCL